MEGRLERKCHTRLSPCHGGTQVIGARLNPHAREIQTIRIPARANRRITADAPPFMPKASLDKRFHPLVINLKQLATQFAGKFAAALAMLVIGPFIHPAGIMEHRKKSDNRKIRTRFTGEHDSVRFHIPPMTRTVNGFIAQRELCSDILPELRIIN